MASIIPSIVRGFAMASTRILFSTATLAVSGPIQTTFELFILIFNFTKAFIVDPLVKVIKSIFLLKSSLNSLLVYFTLQF